MQTVSTMSGALKKDYKDMANLADIRQAQQAQKGAEDLGGKKKDRKDMLKIALMAARVKGNNSTARRYGKPRTDSERSKRHKALYGTTKLPPRGTRLALERS